MRQCDAANDPATHGSREWLDHTCFDNTELVSRAPLVQPGSRLAAEEPLRPVSVVIFQYGPVTLNVRYSTFNGTGLAART